MDVALASCLSAAVGLLSHYPRPPRLPCATGIVNYSVHSRVIRSAEMDDRKYLMAEEVAQRYRGAVSVGTLRNWRAMHVGPAFVKIGKAVLYPVDELDAWDRRNMVPCRASRLVTRYHPHFVVEFLKATSLQLDSRDAVLMHNHPSPTRSVHTRAAPGALAALWFAARNLLARPIISYSTG